MSQSTVNASNVNYTHTIGKKSYELSNHLGNVLVAVSDARIPTNTGGTVTAYAAVLNAATDYTAFGAPMENRTFSSASYRYGFNGKEKENELHSNTGDAYDFGARIYDARLGRFLSRDPKESDYPWQSTYVFAANDPIRLIDINGEGPARPLDMDGNDVSTSTTSSSPFKMMYDAVKAASQSGATGTSNGTTGTVTGTKGILGTAKGPTGSGGAKNTKEPNSTETKTESHIFMVSETSYVITVGGQISENIANTQGVSVKVGVLTLAEYKMTQKVDLQTGKVTSTDGFTDWFNKEGSTKVQNSIRLNSPYGSLGIGNEFRTLGIELEGVKNGTYKSTTGYSTPGIQLDKKGYSSAKGSGVYNNENGEFTTLFGASSSAGAACIIGIDVKVSVTLRVESVEVTSKKTPTSTTPIKN